MGYTDGLEFKPYSKSLHPIEKENKELKNKLKESDEEVAKLELEISRLKKNLSTSRSELKRERKLSGKRVKETRTYKARKEIEKIKKEGFTGKVINIIRDVANRHHLSEGYVTDIWYKEVNHG